MIDRWRRERERRSGEWGVGNEEMRVTPTDPANRDEEMTTVSGCSEVVR
jgi:hypothetical protein